MRRRSWMLLMGLLVGLASPAWAQAPLGALRWWTPDELLAFQARCETSGGKAFGVLNEPRPHMQMLICERGQRGEETWERQIRWGSFPTSVTKEMFP